jgi:hypothetical protein
LSICKRPLGRGPDIRRLRASPQLFGISADDAFLSVQSIQKLAKTVGDPAWRLEYRHGPKKPPCRLLPKLLPDFDGQDALHLDVSAVHNIQNSPLLDFETPSAKEWFPHCSIDASSTGCYGKILLKYD